MRRLHALAVVFGCAALGASRASAEDLIILDPSGFLVTVRDGTGITSAPRGITGLDPDDRLTAIARRPRNGMLYGLSDERLYTIDVATGEATIVGPRFPSEVGLYYRQYGLAFDLKSDLGRIIMPSYTGGAGSRPTGAEDMLLDPVAGSTLRVGAREHLAYEAGDEAEGEAPNVVSVAWLADADPAKWTLLGIDSERRTIVRVGARDDDPKSVKPTPVATLATITGVDGNGRLSGFAVLDDGRAFVVGPTGTGNAPELFALDLATGVASPYAPLWSGEVSVAQAPTATPRAPDPLVVTRGVFRLKSRKRDRGSFELVGTLPEPRNGWEGRTVVFDLDGNVRRFVLNAKGRGVRGPESVRFDLKRATEEGVPFVLKVVSCALPHDGHSYAGPFRTTLQADVYFDGRVLRAQLPFDSRPFRAGARAKLAGM